jgi:hypothetical protein
MKLIQLNEKLLLEKEVSSATLKNIEFSRGVKDLVDEKLWQQAYDSSGFDVEENQLYEIKVEYQPTKGQIDYANKKNGKVLGYDGLKPIVGYLKENPNKKDLENMAKLFVDVVDTTSPPASIEEGYFTILPTKEGATPYSLEGAKELIKELKRVNSGIKSAKEETVRRQDLGYIGSERDLVVQKYLEEMFPGNEQQKIKDFKDVLVKLVKETGFDNNPVVIFLKDFLKNSSLSRRGFIALNNLYAKDVIKAVDFLSSNITGLLKSNILEQGTENASTIIDLYKQILESYYEFNIEEMKELQADNVPFLKLNWKEDGELKDSQSKKNLSDMVIFRPNLINKQVDTIENIRNKMLRLEVKNSLTKYGSEDLSSKDEIRVVGRVPTTIEDSQKNRFDDMFKNITQKDVPGMVRYLKDNKLIG